MRNLRILAAVCAIVPLMTGLILALPDATCSINTPAPNMTTGNVLVPVSNSGEPCYTEVLEGQINNVDSDYASAEELRIMDGAISGLSAPECRWVTVAESSAEARVTVSGPGNPANPPVPPSDYRAAAMQQVQADTYDMTVLGGPILDTGSAVPYVVILYPATGTVSETAANNQLSFNETTDGVTNLRLRILSRAEVSLDSKRVEVSLKGNARQGGAEWSGEMTAWAIGGDDVLPAVIIQQSNNQAATWDVK